MKACIIMIMELGLCLIMNNNMTYNTWSYFYYQSNGL